MTSSTAKLFAASLLTLAVVTASAQQKDDAETRALRDEMKRSMQQLQINGEQKPYFISYKIVDTDRLEASASLGSLTQSGQVHTRMLTVTVRVGDYDFDNTGSGNSSSSNSILSSLTSLLGGSNVLPQDDNYEELRRNVWLATDSAYKRAVQQLSVRKANQATHREEEKIPNFSKQTAREESEVLPLVTIKPADAEQLVRETSLVLRSVPSIETATATFSVTNVTEHFLDSEGTTYFRQIPEVRFHAIGAVRNSTGETFSDTRNEYSRSLPTIPTGPALLAETKEMGTALAARLKGKVAKRYNGPVLLEGQAAADLFADNFGDQLATHRGSGSSALLAMLGSIMGGGTGEPSEGSAQTSFLNKIGSRVLPDFLSVTNNPLITTAGGQPVFGNYKFDEEGVPSQETLLVKDGILKTLLNSRVPVRGIHASTGSLREHGVAPGNLIVEASKTATDEELKAQLIGLIKSRDLPYGYIIRKLANLRAIEASRIYADGHEELVRDARVAEITAASFKDILAVSKDRATYTRSGVGDDLTTYVVPAMLFEDMTVEHVSNDSKPPAVPSPLAM